MTDTALPHTKVTFSTGSILLLCALTFTVCATILHVRNIPAAVEEVKPRIGQTGRIGDLSITEIEDLYGKVNQTAAMEQKDGLRDRIAARRAARRSYLCSTTTSRTAQWAPVYPQSSQRLVYYSRSYSNPTPAYPNATAPSNPTTPATAPNCDNGSCEVVDGLRFAPSL